MNFDVKLLLQVFDSQLLFYAVFPEKKYGWKLLICQFENIPIDCITIENTHCRQGCRTKVGTCHACLLDEHFDLAVGKRLSLLNVPKEIG